METRVNLRRNSDVETSFVVKYFEDFYVEVVRQKERVLAGSWTSIEAGTDDIPGDLDNTAPLGARFILNKLHSILEKQALESSQYGGEFAANYYKEAQFVMAALADEIFLNIEWDGHKYWEDNLLESRLFETHEAGEEFFNKLDLFLRNRDPVRKDLAELYLLALGLGFKGKYRDLNQDADLETYRTQLYTFINHREPKLFSEGERIFANTYTHTLENSKIKHLIDTKLWLSTIAGVFLVLLLISYGVWSDLTGEIQTSIKRILIESNIN